MRWLGFDWGEKALYASDYFDQLYDWALELIRKGKAYVCSLNPEEARAYRGRWNEPGRDSPYRDRSVEENLDLFERMKHGEFENGAHTLRAKIDNSSSNMNLRDPVLYRILQRRAPPHGRQVVHLPDVRTGPTASPTRSKASPTRSARSNSKITGRSTTGSSSRSTTFTCRGRSSSRAST